jgi:hypothetical protein
VLALIPPKETLAATLADADQRMRDWKPPEFLDSHVALAVPEQDWRLDHHFNELEGTDKVLLNRGFESYWVEKAWQSVTFKLDQEGVQLKAQAAIVAPGMPPQLFFDRPFLLYVKKRGAQHAFFAMWVDNAEMLRR